MILDRVTITGVDTEASFDRALEFSKSFPFVEWGILMSAGSGGQPRYPDDVCKLYITGRLISVATDAKLSLHLCGEYLRALSRGENMAANNLMPLWEKAKRVQLNFRDAKAEGFKSVIDALKLFPDKQYIIQMGGGPLLSAASEMRLYGLLEAGLDAVPLFDSSAGEGVVPNKWPHALWRTRDGKSRLYHGYAGGLGPNNLHTQMILIRQAALNARIWIDMESRVRTDNGRSLDFEKVLKVLKAAEPLIGADEPV